MEVQNWGVPRLAAESERDVYKMAAPAGRIWWKHLHLRVRPGSSTLWHMLDKALQVRHTRTVAHTSAVHTQLRIMNVLRSDSAAWGMCRYAQPLRLLCPHPAPSPGGSHLYTPSLVPRVLGGSTPPMVATRPPWARRV